MLRIVGFPQAHGDIFAGGKLALRAKMCATKTLIGGDGDLFADIYRRRNMSRSGRSQHRGLDDGPAVFSGPRSIIRQIRP